MDDLLTDSEFYRNLNALVLREKSLVKFQYRIAPWVLFNYFPRNLLLEGDVDLIEESLEAVFGGKNYIYKKLTGISSRLPANTPKSSESITIIRGPLDSLDFDRSDIGFPNVVDIEIISLSGPVIITELSVSQSQSQRNVYGIPLVGAKSLIPRTDELWIEGPDLAFLLFLDSAFPYILFSRVNRSVTFKFKVVENSISQPAEDFFRSASSLIDFTAPNDNSLRMLLHRAGFSRIVGTTRVSGRHKTSCSFANDSFKVTEAVDGLISSSISTEVFTAYKNV